MDQFAVSMGRRDHAILLDTGSLQATYIPMPLAEHRLVLAHSGKSRELHASPYNERRAECGVALREVRRLRPQIRHLADLRSDPGAAELVLEPVLRRRLRHVLTETQRVTEAADALRRGDLEGFGALWRLSHRSLREDFEVTGPELDCLAEAAWRVEGCLGSRMTGAGFGGCTVSLVRRDAVEEFKRRVEADYRQRTGLEATFWVSDVAEGAREVTNEVT